MVGDKSSVEMTYVPAAIKNGAEIRARHRVLTIETGESGKVTGVVYRNPEGVRQRAETELVVLCGGALLNPSLLLRSVSGVHPGGLGNHSGQVGANLMAHVNGRYMARLPGTVNGFMGISGGVNVQDFYEGDPRGEFHRGYTLYVSLLPSPPETFVNWYLDDWGGDLTGVMESYNRMIRIAVVGEDQASAGNRVYPDPNRKDEDGYPLPRVRYRSSRNELAMFEHAVESARRICRAGGADTWEFFHRATSSAHPLGTCRMGDDPESSVVDRWGACHTVEGLYICDGSVLPTSGAVNPACTIMALAARTADHLIGNRPG
jgi:choline dehydrogenase-like flavoprotein